MRKEVVVGSICLLISLYILTLWVELWLNGGSILNLRGLWHTITNEDLLRPAKLHILALILAFSGLQIITVISIFGSAFLLISKKMASLSHKILIVALPVMVAWQVIALAIM